MLCCSCCALYCALFLADVPHGEVARYGSKPAQHLYNWVFVCLSLLDHTRKMKASKRGDAKSASEGESDKESVSEEKPDIAEPEQTEAVEEPAEISEQTAQE